MKLFKLNPHNSTTELLHDTSLIQEIRDIIVDAAGITHIIETGTCLGTGSTQAVINAYPDGCAPESFITIEINPDYWQTAKQNLSKYPYVHVANGLSLYYNECIEFINNDQAIKYHDKYEDILIDDIDDPVEFYKDEVKGQITKYETHKGVIGHNHNTEDSYEGDGLLYKYLPSMKDNNPLIILDSSGGIGLLEYLTVKKIMGNNRYRLLLDDCNHLKHFRSFNDMVNDPLFSILYISDNNRIVLASHGVK